MAILGSGLLPVTSAAASDTKTDVTALNAYHTYLSATVAGLDLAAKDESSVVQSIATNCPDTLVDLANVTSTHRVEAAVTAFGHEVDADLTLASLTAVKTPLNQLASSLEALEWTSPPAEETTTRLVASERSLVNLHQSTLCADAARLDRKPSSIPPGTAAFLKSYSRAHSALENAESEFGALLSRDAPSTGAGLISEDGSLEAQYAESSASTEQSDAASILDDLGFS